MKRRRTCKEKKKEEEEKKKKKNFLSRARCQALTEALVKEGFDSFMALANTTEEELRAVKMRKGHHVAAVAAVKKLQAEAGGGPMRTLLAANRLDLDPTIFLHAKTGNCLWPNIDIINTDSNGSWGSVRPAIGSATDISMANSRVSRKSALTGQSAGRRCSGYMLTC
nr:hypothetical protein BaRGS_010171 [Batillaria attramentaria]